MAEAIIYEVDQNRDNLAVRHIFEVRGRPGSTFGTRPFAKFSKISNLREDLEVVSWRDGADPLRVRKGIGTLNGGTVTFEKGVVEQPQALIKWFNTVRLCTKSSISLQQQLDGEVTTFNRPLDSQIEAILRGGPNGFIEIQLLEEGVSEINADTIGLYSDLEILVGRCGAAPLDFIGLGMPFATFSAKSVRKIILRKCFPTGYQMSDLDAMASGVAIEALTLAFDEMELA